MSKKLELYNKIMDEVGVYDRWKDKVLEHLITLFPGPDESYEECMGEELGAGGLESCYHNALGVEALEKCGYLLLEETNIPKEVHKKFNKYLLDHYYLDDNIDLEVVHEIVKKFIKDYRQQEK